MQTCAPPKAIKGNILSKTLYGIWMNKKSGSHWAEHANGGIIWYYERSAALGHQFNCRQEGIEVQVKKICSTDGAPI